MKNKNVESPGTSQDPSARFYGLAPRLWAFGLLGLSLFAFITLLTLHHYETVRTVPNLNDPRAEAMANQMRMLQQMQIHQAGKSMKMLAANLGSIKTPNPVHNSGNPFDFSKLKQSSAPGLQSARLDDPNSK